MDSTRQRVGQGNDYMSGKENVSKNASIYVRSYEVNSNGRV